MNSKAIIALSVSLSMACILAVILTITLVFTRTKHAESSRASRWLVDGTRRKSEETPSVFDGKHSYDGPSKFIRKPGENMRIAILTPSGSWTFTPPVQGQSLPETLASSTWESAASSEESFNSVPQFHLQPSLEEYSQSHSRQSELISPISPLAQAHLTPFNATRSSTLQTPSKGRQLAASHPYGSGYAAPRDHTPPPAYALGGH